MKESNFSRLFDDEDIEQLNNDLLDNEAKDEILEKENNDTNQDKLKQTNLGDEDIKSNI